MVLGARRCRAAMAAAPSAIAASTPRAKGTRGYLDRRRNGITGDMAIEVYTQIPRHLLFALARKGATNGYGALVSNLGRNNRLRRLGCRRDNRCGLAFGLDDHGTTCHPSGGAQPLWVGSGCQDTVGIPFSA